MKKNATLSAPSIINHDSVEEKLKCLSIRDPETRDNFCLRRLQTYQVSRLTPAQRVSHACQKIV